MNILYYTSTNVFKHKHLLFLEKSGYNVIKTDSLSDYLDTDIKCIIVMNETDLEAITGCFSNLPVIALFSDSCDVEAVQNRNKKVPLFIRSLSDPIHTIAETVELIIK